MNWLEYEAHYRERLRSALAPVTAPNPAEAEKIEQAICDLVNAKLAMALDGLPRDSATRT